MGSLLVTASDNEMFVNNSILRVNFILIKPRIKITTSGPSGFRMNEINAQYRIICWYLRASFHRKQLLNLLLLFLMKLVPLLNFRIAEPTFRR